jgi:hypothetical protein
MEVTGGLFFSAHPSPTAMTSARQLRHPVSRRGLVEDCYQRFVPVPAALPALRVAPHRVGVGGDRDLPSLSIRWPGT